MEKIKAKAIKYAILLIVIFLLYVLFVPVISYLYHAQNVQVPVQSFGRWYWLFFYLLNSLFALILFLDCRKVINNYIMIPLLSILAPVVGVMFYFVAILLETRKQNL